MKVYDCFGTTQQWFINHYKPLQEYSLKFECECGCTDPCLSSNRFATITIDQCANVKMPTKTSCNRCYQTILEIIEFKHEPMWLIVEPNSSELKKKCESLKMILEKII